MRDILSELHNKVQNPDPVDIINRIVEGELKLDCSVKELINALSDIIKEKKSLTK